MVHLFYDQSCIDVQSLNAIPIIIIVTAISHHEEDKRYFHCCSDTSKQSTSFRGYVARSSLFDIGRRWINVYPIPWEWCQVLHQIPQRWPSQLLSTDYGVIWQSPGWYFWICLHSGGSPYITLHSHTNEMTHHQHLNPRLQHPAGRN